MVLSTNAFTNKMTETDEMNEVQQRIKDKFIEITELGLTDKAKYHAYEEVYPYIIDRFNGKESNILEVGNGEGGGLRILSELFPESKIYGIDYDGSILTIDIEDTNIEVFEYDQTDPKIIDVLPKLDLVIEDASHQFDASMKTFQLLEPLLNPGALYIIEDVYPHFVDSYEETGIFDMYDATEIKNRKDDMLAVYTKK